MPIFAVLPQKVIIVNSVNSGVSRLNATEIVHNVEMFILFNINNDSANVSATKVTGPPKNTNF